MKRISPQRKIEPNCRVRIEFRESEDLSTAQITEFMSLFEAATSLLVRSKQSDFTSLLQQGDAEQLKQLVLKALSSRGGTAFEKYFNSPNRYGVLAVRRISFCSPLQIDYETIPIALAGWKVYKSILPYLGALVLGKCLPDQDIEIGGKDDLLIKIKARSATESAKHIRECFRIPEDMRPVPRMAERLIRLSEDGVQTLLAQETNGTGGFQSLIRRLQSNVNEHTNTIRVGHQDRIRIQKYATEYGEGTFQKTLRKIFKRHLDKLLD